MLTSTSPCCTELRHQRMFREHIEKTIQRVRKAKATKAGQSAVDLHGDCALKLWVSHCDHGLRGHGPSRRGIAHVPCQ